MKSSYEFSREYVQKTFPHAFAHRCAGQKTWTVFVGQDGRPKIIGQGPTERAAWLAAEKNLHTFLNNL